ncbi:hypothetical protein EYR41_010547 [Orbilia oligospora]|uniref:Uncharacterized protein n=1 Tax=Orbilia oligospora TaxID=2813651 RepID=A0A7C8PTN5_ORBOL|nr:hypothetical protein TWF751_000980 [Orbilia oligospora]TGJ64497.1 hypothetical protein EYR41_010547 [Orbilia oligospora]
MHLSIPLTPLAIALLGVSELVSAHVVFVKAVGSGDESLAGYGLGYDANNKRDGGGFFPWQKDVTVFDHKVVHNKWNKKYIHTGCGVTTDSLVTQVQRVDQAGWMHVANKKKAWPWPWQDTIAGGFNDIKWGIDHMAWLEWGKKTRFDNAIKQTLKTGIPKVVPGGKVKITAWQVNQDGGGPFKCMIDYNGNANQWTTEGLPVTTSCQGNADSIRPWGAPAPCEIEVTLPANLNCVGKYTAQRICILRCQNQAHNGPFGGCIPLQQLEPTPQKVVETKKVHVPVVKPAETIVLPPKVVTVTKDNVITIIQGGHTRVSVPTKNNIVTVTQVIERPPKTVVEVQEKTVVIEKQVYPTKVLTDIGRPIKPSPRPPTNKKPTEAELKAGLGGEDYDNSVIEELRNVYITDEEKQKLGKQASQKSSYYKRKLRFRRNADEE